MFECKTVLLFSKITTFITTSTGLIVLLLCIFSSSCFYQEALEQQNQNIFTLNQLTHLFIEPTQTFLGLGLNQNRHIWANNNYYYKTNSRLDQFKVLKDQLYEEFYKVSKTARPQCVYDPYEVEYRLNTIQLLVRDGYSPETHYITTPDGYIFELHRIPAPGKPVVFFMTGFSLTSRECLINCYGRAIGHKLFSGGYDVWLGNYRGNEYGRNHTCLDPEEKSFWEFSNDELGIIDFPAAIDYILAYTGQRKLNWVGYSMGATSIFSLLSTLPEYNEKMNIVIALAPCPYLCNTRSLVLKVFAYYWRIIEKVLTKVWNGIFNPPKIRNLLRTKVPQLCLSDAEKDGPGKCTALLPSFDTKNPYQTNYAKLAFIFTGFPSTTSVRVFCHWLQWVTDPNFRMYDFGKETNLVRYGSQVPPAYDLTKVTAPVVLFYAPNDPIATIPDVARLACALPNLEGAIRVNFRYWSHNDFLFARDADVFVYDHIIAVLNSKNPSML